MKTYNRTVWNGSAADGWKGLKREEVDLIVKLGAKIETDVKESGGWSCHSTNYSVDDDTAIKFERERKNLKPKTDAEIEKDILLWYKSQKA